MKKMSKSDLVLQMSNEIPGCSIKDAQLAVDVILNEMTNTLVNRGNVEIRGFGTFTIREYEGYTGRNPKTGEHAKVKKKSLPFFKVGKELRDGLMGAMNE